MGTILLKERIQTNKEAVENFIVYMEVYHQSLLERGHKNDPLKEVIKEAKKRLLTK